MATSRNGIALAILVIGGAWFFFGRTPPQIGTDEAVFRTVDALYTAVRNEDAKQLAACKARLNGYRDAGKLSAKSAGYLDDVIRTAEAGSWRSAAERLYALMAAQRRE